MPTGSWSEAVTTAVFFLVPGAGEGEAGIICVEDIFANPALLAGKTPEDIAGAIGDIPSGWRLEGLGRATHEGQGWLIREYNAAGNKTGRVVRWHPGGGRHGPDPYWIVTSSATGKVRIPPLPDDR